MPPWAFWSRTPTCSSLTQVTSGTTYLPHNPTYRTGRAVLCVSSGQKVMPCWAVLYSMLLTEWLCNIWTTAAVWTRASIVSKNSDLGLKLVPAEQRPSVQSNGGFRF